MKTVLTSGKETSKGAKAADFKKRIGSTVYVALKGEVAEVDKIRCEVYNIMREEQRRTQPQRAQGMER